MNMHYPQCRLWELKAIQDRVFGRSLIVKLAASNFLEAHPFVEVASRRVRFADLKKYCFCVLNSRCVEKFIE